MASSSSDHVYSSPPSRPSDATTKFDYPFAAAPDIIRSNQKDTYFQGVLFEQLSSILRTLYGSRFAHNHNSEARTFTELLYFGLTTLVGNRTLGEEYCDIIQISDNSLHLPSFCRRAGYILSTVLLPYTLTKFLPALRNRVRLKLEANLRQKPKVSNASLAQLLQSYLLNNLSNITSPSSIYAITLSIFYFTGSYYHLGKRLFGLRYIFTKRPAPSDQRVGYEVLGVLLVLQMIVQGWLHLYSTLNPPTFSPVGTGDLSEQNAIIGRFATNLDHQNSLDSNNNLIPARENRSQSRLEATTHTPILGDHPRYDLQDGAMMGWIDGQQQRKCTLCLEEMKDPSVTTCGHVFCWTCIGEWIREKPECPLCRQSVLAQHVLPLRG
ncbi:peroxisome biogenesis factor 10 [Pseudocyphellaria aurata]|nr:peroxisome biogenesis factor 10 [Pseudocyphellaria aurata]